MIETLKVWLKETWELWYWAMFYPSRLQQRMNEWSPAPVQEGKRLDTTFQDILLFNLNRRFLVQFLQVVCFFGLLFAFTILLKGQIWDWFLIPIILLAAYSVGFCFLPIGLHIPLFFNIIYLVQPSFFISTLHKFVEILPPLSQIGLGVILSSLGMIITTILGIRYLEQEKHFIGRSILITGSTISILIGCWIGNPNLFFVLLTSLTNVCLGLFLSSRTDCLTSSDSWIFVWFDIAFSVSFGILFSISFNTGGIVGGVVGGIVSGVFTVIIVRIYLFILDIGIFEVGIAFINEARDFLSDNAESFGENCGNFFGSFVAVITALIIMFSYSASGAGDTTSFADIIGRIIAGSGAGILIGLIAGCILRFAFTAIMIISSYTVFIAGSVAGFVGAVSLIAVGTTVGTTVGTAVGIAVGIVVGGGLIVISNLPLLWFFLICWFVSASFSPNRQQWSVILITSTFAALGIEYHGWLIVTAIPVVLAGYYRILDFFFFEFLSELPVLSLSLLRYPLPIDVTWQLRHLPPFTSELLWLPITNHDRLLVATFQEDLDEALCIFKAIQSQPLFGYQTTINRALPQIIADQIAKVNTIHELIATVSLNHPTLPILVPSLYQTGETQIEIPKIVEIFPNFYIIAQDIKTALEISNIGLRKRSLERIKEQLILLSKQLSGLIKPQSIERWQTVIDRWQTIIQIEIDLLTQQFQPPTIQNPFEFGKPLGKDSSKLFKGRTTFAEEIVRQILDAKLHTIVLYGPRRCGKSSFLLNLHHLLSSDILPVYIDLQSLSSLQSEADFCFAIVRNIYREAKVQQISLPIHPNREEFHRGPYPHLEDWLYAALTQLAGKRILINFDEFEAISRAMEQGRITTNLFDELRSLIQHWDRLSFLFSGVQTLDELGTNWSSYFISAMPIEMTYLNPDEARELLLNPDPEFALEYDTGIVDQILTLTRCHPYLLQLLGWVLVQLANTTHTQLVTPTLLQSAIPEAYIKGIGYFTNVWEQFTGTTPTEITAGQQQLLALAQGQQPHPTNESAQKSLQRMLRYHIIEKIDNQYKFEVPLIERWVREKST